MGIALDGLDGVLGIDHSCRQQPAQLTIGLAWRSRQPGIGEDVGLGWSPQRCLEDGLLLED